MLLLQSDVYITLITLIILIGTISEIYTIRKNTICEIKFNLIGATYTESHSAREITCSYFIFPGKITVVNTSSMQKYTLAFELSVMKCLMGEYRVQ